MYEVEGRVFFYAGDGWTKVGLYRTRTVCFPYLRRGLLLLLLLLLLFEGAPYRGIIGFEAELWHVC